MTQCHHNHQQWSWMLFAAVVLCNWSANCYAAKNLGSSPCATQSGKFACENSTKCYLPIQLCDGDRDCPLGDDERNCSVKSSVTVSRCGSGFFGCRNGAGCIPMNKVCNVEKDCVDASDETSNACITRHAWDKKFSPTCEAGQTLCNLKKTQCISSELLCDGQTDCQDGSDEIGCAASNKKKCDFNCTNGTGCVLRRQICDGIPNCADKSDELACPKGCQKADQLPCQRNNTKNGRNNNDSQKQQHNFIVDFIVSQAVCYYKVQKCDGTPQCPNNADEENCPIQCTRDQFRCDDENQCIAANRTCDGIADCHDHSDEFTCSIRTNKCDQEKAFECPHSNGSVRCIPLQKVCNGIKDCPDGRDERSIESARNCLNNPCLRSNGNCEHICVNHFGTARCLCKKGFQLQPNGQSCADIDECAQWGRCPQHCSNLRGTYHCSCSPGYHYNERNRTCDPEVAAPLAILYNTPRDIRLYFLHSSKISTLHPILPQHPFVSMDYSLRGNQLTVFWVEYHEHSCLQSITIPNLLHANVNNITVHPPVHIGSSHDVNGLSMDGVNNLLYWIADDGVFVMNTQNQHWTQIVFMEGMGRAIVAVPQLNQLYFVNAHDKELLQSTLDGQEIHAVHSIEEPEFVRYLAWDVSLRRITWLDENIRVIFSLDPISGDVKTLELDVMPQSKPSGFSIYNEEYFWSDAADQGSIHSLSKFASTDEIRHSKRRHTGAHEDWHAHGMLLHVVHPYNRPVGYSFCYQHSCSHICLPRQSNVETVARHRCACPQHMTLNPDERTCNETNEEPTVCHPHHRIAKISSKKIIPEHAKGGSSYWLLIAFIIMAFLVVAGVIISRGRSNRPLRQLQATVSAKLHTIRTCNKTQSIHFDNPVYQKPVLVSEEPEIEHKLLEL